jgi:membrane-associated phospholipid phosphatase
MAIPFVPEMIWVYLSINLLFALPLFRLRTQELTLLGRRMIVTTVIAVAFFLLAPTALGFARQSAGSDLASVYRLLYALDAPYNCAPSLHVAYASQIILALAHRGPYRLRAALALWLLLIMASTVLTHQHHLLDLAGGLLLTASTRLATAQRSEGAGGVLLRPRRMVSHAAGADR